MFDRPKKSKIEKKDNHDDNGIEVNSMPSDFYGGKNPVIEFKEETQEIDLNKYKKAKSNIPTKAEKQDFDKQQSQHLKKSTHPANLLTNPKFLLLIAGIIFVLVIIVGGIYFWLTTRTPQKNTDNNDNIPVVSVVTTTDNKISTSTVTTTTSTIDSGQTASSSISVDKIDFPSILLGYGQDYDGDKLFDTEEQLLGSDPSIVDSDKDGHLDGHEVFHLYNPISIEPNRLIDSGKVAEYANPNFGYKIYYPKDWTYGSIDSNNRDLLFTAINGESVEVKVFDLDASQTFDQWFAIYAPEEYTNNLNDFESVFTQKGKVRNDKLVYYFVDDRRVYVIVYRASSASQVNYRQIMEMMARSFRTSNNSYIKQWAAMTPTTSTTEIVSSTTKITSSTKSIETTSSTAN